MFNRWWMINHNSPWQIGPGRWSFLSTEHEGTSCHPLQDMKLHIQQVDKLAPWFLHRQHALPAFFFHPLATECVGECRYRLGCWLPYTQLPCEKKKRHHHLQRRSVCPHVRLWNRNSFCQLVEVGLNTNHFTILTGWTAPHLKTQSFVSVFFFT